ncbi:SAM-dependent DNA methyltransferase [Clostridium sporogenes]|uniref:N-6 DNA methylase n=1 Tax=Clostridium sporogenes TaxID=1509 RepID=UPI0013CFDE64|nr:N-6 DNA methylase [Clostridium sporogenes]MBA4508042.1 SAM-dependent DNA methyltransferase [Clostridium sporogenes]MDU6337736.1 N-6 DNA methylase [Clostridium sporogenes]NFQ84371.1 SAM-dependent DNA methyltransferase [Clostridium sporogenes]
MRKVGTTSENERSWAIDLISQINTYVCENSEESIIQHAGGEMSLSTGAGSLFPDTLLFGDKGKTSILQGWELKYPDTNINDYELINNAKIKAELLGVNSFLVWNVSIAKLYAKNNEDEDFKVIKEWNSLSHITTRTEVAYNMHEVKNELYTILNDLNYFFRNGILKSEKILNSISGEKLLSLMFNNVESCAESIKNACIIDGDLNDEIVLWWDMEGATYGKKANKWFELSKLAIISLMNKFIFANILKKYNSKANIINSINEASAIDDCLDIFDKISKSCDFYNIFEEKIGEKYIDDDSLSTIINFNKYLVELDFTNYNDTMLERVLTQVVTRSKRKVAGQFSTPRELAIFLATLTIKNKVARVLDPCCGTGTIAKASYDIKRISGITSKDSIKQIWAGDKFRYPLQFAMLALTSPENIGQQINIYKEDVFNLLPDEKISIHDVNSNNILSINCGKYDAIISNLPFVQQENLLELNSTAVEFINKTNDMFNGRSDLYAYIVLKLDDILSEHGRIGIIVSNSWLGTEFGDKFFTELKNKYNVEYIITSGKGRWFKNADVVTNIIILNKKDIRVLEKIKFVVINKDITQLIGKDDLSVQIENASKLVAKIRKGINTQEFIINGYSEEEIKKLDEIGIIKNSLFTNCRWLLEFKDKLVPITKYFNIKRGERRGCNELFYPRNHNIESEYIVPVMKKLDTSSYVMNLDASIDGFVCGKSLSELEKLGHLEARKWINKFDGSRDKSGKVYNEKLARANLHWYEMSLNSTFDVGLLINPDERLFFSKAPYPIFFDQRLTGLIRKDKSYDLTILVAMLNSILGIFYIEAIGFGRGLGVLDLNKNKIEKRFRMLNPKLLNKHDKNEIIELYKKLETRNVKSISEELEQTDRATFDKAVLKAFGLELYYENIKNSLLQLFNIRKSVKK